MAEYKAEKHNVVRRNWNPDTAAPASLPHPDAFMVMGSDLAPGDKLGLLTVESLTVAYHKVYARFTNGTEAVYGARSWLYVRRERDVQGTEGTQTG